MIGTGSLSGLMAVTDISDTVSTDNADRKLSDLSQKFVVSVVNLTVIYKDIRLYLCL